MLLSISVIEPDPEVSLSGPRVFATTHWSVVLSAGRDDAGTAQRALETLCRSYWYPIYVFVRRKGYGPDEAQDLTQEFFAQLIAKERLRLADPEKGRFRTFLLAMLDTFLAREWRRAHRQKRGGQFIFVSLDQQTPEERYQLEPADDKTPEDNYQRQWALAVLAHALNLLAEECEASGKGSLFRELKSSLTEQNDKGTYAEIAQRLHMAEGTIRVAVHRFRQRYGDLVRSEVAKTVGRFEDIDDELRSLLEALSR
jgi:RNA polymerase sigma-70 factor (ECF subfamily)